LTFVSDEFPANDRCVMVQSIILPYGHMLVPLVVLAKIADAKHRILPIFIDMKQLLIHPLLPTAQITSQVDQFCMCIHPVHAVLLLID